MAALAVLASIATIVSAIPVVVGWFPGGAASPAGQARVSPIPSDSSERDAGIHAPSSSAGQAQSAGDCVSAQGRPQACDDTHWGQIISASGAGCTRANALTFMGGLSDVDTVRDTVDVQTQGPNCVLVGKAEQKTSLADVLKSPRGDMLRLCLDSDGAEVGCGAAHAAEVVKTASSYRSLQCEEAADTYLEISPSQLAQEIEVGEGKVGGVRRCIIRARGDNDLTASVRRLKSGALPLRARS